MKGRFRVLRYGLRWHDAESNHQTFVVCAMLHNAIVDYRETAADGYDLDNVHHFGSAVGDFEPYGEDERNLLRDERQIYRVIGRAGLAEEFDLLSFAEEEAQLKQLRAGGTGSASGSSYTDGRRRSSSRSSSAGGGGSGGSSSSSGGGGVIAGDDADDDEHEASSSSAGGGGSSSGGGGVIAGDDGD